MASTQSTGNREGRYTQGGTSTQTDRLRWWERRIIPYSDDDMFIVISNRYHRRPDVLAFDMYRKAKYQWLVLQYNNIVDVNTEFVVGTTVRLPSLARVQREIMTRTS